MERSSILSKPVMEKGKLKTYFAFIYVTERCNLNCEYCYFRHKHGRDVSPDAVEKFFSLFEKEGIVPAALVFSGGEVFLAKERLFEMLKEARRRFGGISLHVQTNGSLIDEASIEILRELDVCLGFGIDGACEQTIRRRRGLDAASFKRLTETLRMCMNAGISCGCTMTIHPEEVKNMAEGLIFLQELGFSHVDVTPAAFMPWTPQAISLFKKNYLAAARDASIRKLFLVHDDVQEIEAGSMDLSLHPPGYLLGGDPFLCLPEEQRKQFDLWDIASGKLKPDVLSFYRDAYDRMYGDNDRALYREYVCHSFDLINKMVGEEYINAGAINDISRFLTRAHRTLRFQRSTP